MTVRIVSRPQYSILECWGCGASFMKSVDRGFSEDDIIWDLIMSARDKGWVARRDGDEVFALCPSCVASDLARLLRSLYTRFGGSRGSRGSPSARGPDGARAPSGLWRRIMGILRFQGEVDHGEVQVSALWD